MPTGTNRRTLGLAAIVLVAATALVTTSVSGTRQSASDSGPRYATVDLLSLLEDMLQMDDYKPDRDAYRLGWEERIEEAQAQIQQVETELRMSAPNNPNIRTLQQQYQQLGYNFNQLRNEAGMGFDQFNAEQAAEAYQRLHTEAFDLAKALGYTHLFVSRPGGEITERGNLATVTQEILARPIAMTPEGDTLTDRLRERMAIPVPPEPTEEDAVEDEAGPDDAGAPADTDSDEG